MAEGAVRVPMDKGIFWATEIQLQDRLRNWSSVNWLCMSELCVSGHGVSDDICKKINIRLGNVQYS